MMAEQVTAWAHNTETSGDGTVPVICHATVSQLAQVQGRPDEWHLATDNEYERFERYWAKEFPNLPQEVIEEEPV